MFELNYRHQTLFVGFILQGFLYGLYSGIFAMSLQYWQASKKDGGKKRNIIFYSMCALYVLSFVLFVSDTMVLTFQFSKPLDSVTLHLSFIQMASFACCDFIAQLILIYRCWIVWGCNIRVAIIPSILAFAFLVTWLVDGSSIYISASKLEIPKWGILMNLSSLTLSLTVNALVTGLIVFRIVRASLNDEILGTTGGSKLRRTITVLIESSMALLFIQLARVAVTIVGTETAFNALAIITPIHNMLNGITPTVILVRISMGLSFHDAKSTEEVGIGSLRFASNHLISIPETGSITFVAVKDSRDDDSFDIRRSNDIDMVERST